MENKINATFGDFQVQEKADGSFVMVDLSGCSRPRPSRTLEMAIKLAQDADKMFPQEISE